MTAVRELVVDPAQGVVRMPVDVSSRDDDDLPAEIAQQIAGVAVVVPLASAGEVQKSVILDDDAFGRVLQVYGGDPLAVLVEDRRAGFGTRQAGQDDEEPEPGLHQRVDSRPDEAGGMARSTDMAALGRARSDLPQGLGRREASPYRGIAQNGQVDQRQMGGGIHEGLLRPGHR